MPIKVPDNLPTKALLRNENIFVMDESRAFRQDIRPLKILIVNLMPLKQQTEAQLFRLLGNSPLQVEITLTRMATHDSKNTSADYLLTYYKTFAEVKDEKFDGCVITGAPVERLLFEKVNYWDELCALMEWTKTNVYSTFHICWGAQAALYYHYGVNKTELPEKTFGVFEHAKVNSPDSPNKKLLRGFDETFNAPHSRHTTILRKEIEKAPDVEVLAESPDAGLYLLASLDCRQVFALGHSEYDPCTLQNEYWRDVKKGDAIAVPKNYFEKNDPLARPIVKWRAHANLLYTNWLNYYVYQETPFNFLKY